MNRLIVIAMLLVCAACARVARPTSDPSPPTMSWVVQNMTRGGSQTFPATGGRYTGRTGDRLLVTMRVQDPEGVEYVDLRGEAQWTCIQGDTGQQASALYPTESQTYTVDDRGTVPTLGIMAKNITLDFGCNPGWTYEGGGVGYWGSGRNFFGGRVTGRLSIEQTP